MHQFIDRQTSEIKDEVFYGDRFIKFIYSTTRENPALMYNILTSKRLSKLLGFFCFDSFIGSKVTRTKHFISKLGINYSECLDNPKLFDTPRKIFERKIRYWEKRPMPSDEAVIVSPCDAKVLIGSSNIISLIQIKNKFFQYEELIGYEKREWLDAFRDGDFAIFRLTPEKYHYNHMPVSGVVLDIYEIDGCYHSCHPEITITLCSPYSKNKRVISIFDTDVEGGSHVGLVAMIEIVALIIGDIVQCYSEERYDNPQKIKEGMFLRRGQPKSLFRPCSSTVILIFQRNKITFSTDLIKNTFNDKAKSAFSRALNMYLVETDIKVRSPIGTAVNMEKQ